MNEEQYFQENVHIRCSKCGTRNFPDAKRCRNAGCRADLMVFGTFVDPLEDEKNRIQKEKERTQREETERQRQEEEERKRREHEAWERRQQEEADRRAKEEADRQARLKKEQEERARAEREKAYREEQERWQQEEEQRRKEEEAQRRAQAEADRQAEEEAQRLEREKNARREEKEKKEKKKGGKRKGWLAAIVIILVIGIIAAVAGSILLDSGGSYASYDDSDNTDNGNTIDDSEDAGDTEDVGGTDEEEAAGDSRILMSDTSLGAVLGNDDYDRSQIVSITFLDSTEDALSASQTQEKVIAVTLDDGSDSADDIADVWDVSQEADRSVLAWTIEADDGLYDLYIAAEGGVTAPENCQRLFALYKNLVSIDFNDCFDTSQTVNMRSMFASCTALEAIDFTGFNFSNVTNLSDMFYLCTSLRSVSYAVPDVSNVTDISYMFYGVDEGLVEDMYDDFFYDMDYVIRDDHLTSSYDDTETGVRYDSVSVNVIDSGADGSENLFDDDEETVWTVDTSEDDPYIIFETSESIVLDSLGIGMPADSEDYEDEYPGKFVIYGANGSDVPETGSDEWTEIDVKSEFSLHAGMYTRIYFDDLPEEYCYYMLVVTEAADGYGEVRIGEIKLYH